MRWFLESRALPALPFSNMVRRSCFDKLSCAVAPSLLGTGEEKVDDATNSAKKATDKVADKSKETAKKVGDKVEKTGSKIKNA